MKFLLLFFSMMVLRCCWGPSEYQLMKSMQNETTFLKSLNGTYSVNTLKGEDVATFNLTINFDDSTKQVSGFSGCNRFFGTYTLENNSLKFGALGATRMLCEESKNNIENQLLKVFEIADTVFFTENGFSLYHKKNELLYASAQAQNNLSFEYSASSRASYKHIIIDKDFIVFSKKRGGKSLKKACKKEYWKKLLTVSDTLNFDKVPKLIAPSKKFLFDGAALARFQIRSNGEIYESVPFDHGNPPAEIATLVKEILSIAENIE